LAWCELKDRVVYVIAVQLISEQEYADVGSVHRRLDEIERPLRVPGWHDDTGQATRNCLNRLSKRGLLVEVDHGKRKRWVDAPG
jgi:hypothetical protein